jgi:hypothetical protein
MSIIDRFTSTHDLLTETHTDDQQQNNDRVLNPETRRALDRELRATRRLWTVILAFVPFVYVSAFLWTLGLSVQLLAVFLAADMLAGFGVSMYVAIRLNLILRPRGESQALPDADVTLAEDEDADESEGENETVKTRSEPDETGNPAQQATAPEQSDQPDPQEADDQQHEPSDPETDSDGEPADEHAETQSTHDTDTSSERVIS